MAQDAKSLPEGLTVQAIAKALNCCHETIRRGIYAGEIPYVRIGRGRGVIRIPRRWLEEKLRGAGR